MNTNATLEQLRELKLTGMADSYEAITQLPVNQQPDAHGLLAQLVDSERLSREQRRTQMYLKLSKLRYVAPLVEVKADPTRGLSKDILAGLADCAFILRAENVLITGATGCGKSFLACALGHQACLQGHKSLYLNMNRFTEQVMLSKLEGTFIKLLNQLEKYALLILDDFGLQPLKTESRLALLQILEDRYGRKSTILASQLPVAQWHEYIQDATIADAILDRITSQAHRIELKGKSLRKKIQ